jgi:hypothetical protein
MFKLTNISASRIKCFDTCLFQYYLKYVDKAEMRSNWGAAHGSLIHDVCEMYTNGTDKDYFGRLFKGYRGELTTLDRKGEMSLMESPLVWAKSREYHERTPYCGSCQYAVDEHCKVSNERLDSLTGCPKMLFDGSIEMLNKVFDRYQDHIWPKLLRSDDGFPVGAEYAFSIPLKERPDVPILGFMDLVVEEDEDTIQVIDYKAGKKTQTYEECRDDIQCRMYSLACRKEFIEDVNNKGYKYKNVVLTFDYFREKPVTLAFTEEEDAATERFIIDKIKEIESTEWIDRIVRDNEELETKTKFGQVAFTCKYLCDSKVCKEKWDGRFKLENEE